MSDTTFTKGKWVICEVGDTVWIDDEQGFSIAQVYDCKGAIDNAPLIAAAPDMYKLLSRLWELNCPKEYCTQDEYSALNDIEDLLTKARGES